jgi:RNA polymerase sigma-70 factor (ECF subfamily)
MLANETIYWNCMLEGDKNAFLTIYNNFYTSLFQYGFGLTKDKELTKDCIQELFLEIWNTRSSINKNVIDVKSYLFTWLRRKISRTLSIQTRKRSGENKRENCDAHESSYEELLIAFQGTENKKEKLERALNRLTKKQLEIIRLKFFDNLSYEEIAMQTSLTTRTVYNTIYEALRHLRDNVTLLV